MKKNDWKKWAVYSAIGLAAVCFLFWVVIPAAEIILGYAGNFLFAYIDKHPVGVFIAASIAGFFVHAATRPQPEEDHNPKWEPKPTESDYFTVLQTLRPAVAEVAEALRLAPIYSHTDMAADPKERIIPGIYFWGLNYKAPKRNVTDTIDVEQARRVIQAQVKTVLERDNPSRFTDTIFPYHGTLEPVIQIDEVQDGEAYIHIFAVIASDTYFKNRKKTNGDGPTLHTEADTDDPTF